MLSILWRFLAITLFITVIGLVVIYNKDITSFQEVYQVNQDGKKALETENWPKATEIYEQGLKAHPDQVEIAMTLGDLYRRQSQDDKAEALYKNLLEADRNNLKVRIVYAELLKDYPNRINEAVNLCREALKQFPEDPKLLGALGDIYKQAAENPQEHRKKLKQWLYEWAIYYYRMALKVDPQNFQTRFNLGYAYQKVDRLQKSAMEYCNAILLSPDSYESHYNMGVVLVQMNAVLLDSYRYGLLSQY